MTYFVWVDGGERGPISKEELMREFADAKLNGLIPCRPADDGNWTTVAAIIQSLHQTTRPDHRPVGTIYFWGGFCGAVAATLYLALRLDAGPVLGLEPNILDLLWILVAGWLLGLLYVIPIAIAYRRAHYNAQAITVLTVFAGWTVVGWIGSLVWAFTNRPGPSHDLPPS